MKDILLDKDGDIVLSQSGDIRVEESLQQKILIRLKWFLGEWRWNISEGLPYWERLFRKGPQLDLFLADMRSKIMEIPEVSAVNELNADWDEHIRNVKIKYAVRTTRDEIIREEVICHGWLWNN